MSENRTPTPGDDTPSTPPPAPPAPPAPDLTAFPVPPAAPAPPSQAGAVPISAPPANPGYGAQPGAYPRPGTFPQPGTYPQPGAYPQPGYAPPAAHGGNGIVPAQPGYAPAYAPPTYPLAAPRPTSGLAITSLVCGIAGIVLFWAIVPLLASIAAVVTGHMALGRIKRDPAIAGRGMAIAGLILGYVVVGIGAFVLVSTVISFLFLGAFTLPFLFTT